ncbi:CobN component of cobalt chelatase [Cutibacterium acnes JCM 18909]|nr:CobN component of cobalt chelatase [Cutibacterium acnes JCM 18909]
MIDRAVRMVAALPEPDDDNMLRAHVEADVTEMIARGVDVEQARRKATLRVFGCPPGGYGAGVEELIETKAWQDKADLGRAYIAASSHAYGEGVFGQVETERFTASLKRMDVTVKNEDTREYDMLSCTDFYNYYGGLIAAATTVRGEAPMSLVGDSSDPSRIATRTTTEEARLILRSRILNPSWIEGLQRHGIKEPATYRRYSISSSAGTPPPTSSMTAYGNELRVVTPSTRRCRSGSGRSIRTPCTTSSTSCLTPPNVTSGRPIRTPSRNSRTPTPISRAPSKRSPTTPRATQTPG